MRIYIFPYLISRYKVYLEPDEDDNPESTDPTHARRPLQEKPIPSFDPSASPPPPLPSRPRMPTSTTKKTSSTLPKKSARRSLGASTGTSNGMRMGTKLSFSALHRERLRLCTEMPIPPPKKRSLDLDYDTMEFKSLIRPESNTESRLPPAEPRLVVPSASESRLAPNSAYVLALEQQASNPYDDQESLSDSLIERFDNMDAEGTEPERRIVSVILAKGPGGRLGLKITGTPAGIFIDGVDESIAILKEGKLKLGDRIVAINGRSLENVSYSSALDLIKKSNDSVQFLVSQINN